MNTISKIFLILMTLSWSVGLSQDTQIQLESKIARLVVKDLINGDSAKEQLKITEEQVNLLEGKVQVKDSIILKKDLIIANYEHIIGAKDDQLKTSKELSKKLKNDLKVSKSKLKLFKTGSGILGILAILLIL